MSFSERVFLIVLIINTIIAIAYFLWGILAHTKNELGENRRIAVVLRGVVILLCPVVGVCFFLVSIFIGFVFFRATVDLDDVMFSKERVKTMEKADEEREKNIVPLQEALSVTDHTKLRQLMLNVLKGDIDKSLSTIALALDSEDSETSHYAASILSKALNEFRINVRKLQQEIERETKKEGDEFRKAECGILLLEYMDSVLCQKVFTEVEQKYFVDIMAKTGEYLYQSMLERREQDEKNPLKVVKAAEVPVEIPVMGASHYSNIALCLLGLKDFKNAEVWSNRALEQYPGELCSYKCKLKLLFATDRQEPFLEVLHQLKSSQITVDNETLEMIRVFDRR